jgi:hypothetical protein
MTRLRHLGQAAIDSSAFDHFAIMLTSQLFLSRKWDELLKAARRKRVFAAANFHMGAMSHRNAIAWNAGARRATSAPVPHGLTVFRKP